jgi:hypothetical protein
MGEAKRKKLNDNQSPAWLTNGPFPDWIAEEPDKQFGGVAEAWVETVEITREISPNMEEQQIRALRMVFYAGAACALETLPLSRGYAHLETLMSPDWETFTRDCITPFVRPISSSACSPEVMREETAAIVDHQHGYWLGGARAAILCLRAGAVRAELEKEIETARDEVVARHGEGAAIKPIRRRPLNAPPANPMFHREVSWWSKDDGAVVGAVIEDQVDHDFAFVVFERNERRLYNAINCQASLPTQVAATEALHAAMSDLKRQTLDDLIPGVSRERVVDALEEVSGVAFARCPKCGAPTVPGRDDMLCDDCYGEGLDA